MWIHELVKSVFLWICDFVNLWLWMKYLWNYVVVVNPSFLTVICEHVTLAKQGGSDLLAKNRGWWIRRMIEGSASPVFTADWFFSACYHNKQPCIFRKVSGWLLYPVAWCTCARQKFRRKKTRNNFFCLFDKVTIKKWSQNLTCTLWKWFKIHKTITFFYCGSGEALQFVVIHNQ